MEVPMLELIGGKEWLALESSRGAWAGQGAMKELEDLF
jgi:hypothetical protein